MSKRIRIFTASDVAQHNNVNSCWVTCQGKVYDVTNFARDHPGGEEYILKFAGKDVEEAMTDVDEHVHSDSAYDMLQELVVGRVGVGELTVNDHWEATDDYHPENTDEAEDFRKNEFLDLRKPLFMQMWEGRFSKAYYLQQVHQPRHLGETARMFKSPYLEVFTRTEWYVVPVIWLPIAIYIGLRSLFQFAGIPLASFKVDASLPISSVFFLPVDAYVKLALCFFLGNAVWTILEYAFHRFLFHLDEHLPDTPVFLTLHFLMHGVHHYMPMDPLRLVMPPVMFFALSFPMTRLAHTLFSPAMANGVISGAFSFYVLYDCMHYAMHHTRLPAYLREMKKYHLGHHYKNYELGFGVTSKVWDYVFNTVLPL
ncbi:fatty acid-2 hydroxylase [Amylostereum chailletii]|nr:fatty acid-2 hydroxylase [Amylostereum chailletii]